MRQLTQDEAQTLEQYLATGHAAQVNQRKDTITLHGWKELQTSEAIATMRQQMDPAEIAARVAAGLAVVSRRED